MTSISKYWVLGERTVAAYFQVLVRPNWGWTPTSHIWSEHFANKATIVFRPSGIQIKAMRGELRLVSQCLSWVIYWRAPVCCLDLICLQLLFLFFESLDMYMRLNLLHVPVYTRSKWKVPLHQLYLFRYETIFYKHIYVYFNFCQALHRHKVRLRCYFFGVDGGMS